MSFDMRYDRNGDPIRDKNIHQVMTQQEVVPEIEQPEVEIAPVQDQVVQQEVPDMSVQEAPEPHVEVAPVVKPAQKTPADSFRELRVKAERAEKAERERDELLRRLYEKENSPQKHTQQQEPEDLEFSVAADDLVEGKHLSKVDKKIKQLEQQIYAYQQQSTLATTEARLKAQYADFDQVVSKENLEILSYTYPGLARTINATPDIYDKAESAYMMIKNMGIAKPKEYEMEKRRIQENAAKPRLSPAVASAQQGDSPLSKANMFSNGLTTELQEQLRKEMYAAMKTR